MPEVLHRRTPENLARPAAALAPYHPYLRGAPAGLPFRFDVETIRRELNFTLTTDLGDLDLLGEMTGGGTYEPVIANTIELLVFGRTVNIGRRARWPTTWSWNGSDARKCFQAATDGGAGMGDRAGMVGGDPKPTGRAAPAARAPI